MFCPKCGAQIPDGSGFCPKCGNKIGAPTAGAASEAQAGGATPANGAFVAPTVSNASKGKIGTTKIIIIAAAIVAVVVLILCLTTCSGKKVDSNKNITPAAVQTVSIDKLQSLGNKYGYDVSNDSYGDAEEYEFSKDDSNSNYFDVYVKNGKTVGFEYDADADSQAAAQKYVKKYLKMSNVTNLDDTGDKQADIAIGTCKVGGEDGIVMVTYDDDSASIDTVTYDYATSNDIFGSMAGSSDLVPTDAKSLCEFMVSYYEMEGYTTL